MNSMIILDFTFLIIIFFILLFMLNKLKHNKRIKEKNVIIFSIAFFTLATAFIIFLSYKLSIPKFNIIGEEIIKVNVFDEYNDDGFYISNSKLKDKVVVSNNVNTSLPGVYDVTYTLNYFKKSITIKRKVIVEDNVKPIIELIGGETIEKKLSNDFIEPGYKAIDNVDGDITNKVKITNNFNNTIGTHEIIYEVEDSSGNKTIIKRFVNVINDNNGVVYLTFDDGPSSSTSKILDILKNENIKATFFVVNYSDYYSDMIKRIVDEGHSIALHSYTHNYKLIYSSEEAYFDDLYKLRDKVKDTTGVLSNIIRFPGGSSNTISSFNKGIMTRLTKNVKEKGFHYFDWNVDSSDAWSAKNKGDVYNNVVNGLIKNRNNVVLMHDLGHNVKTIEALPDIISYAKKKGYTFEKITYNTPMIVHGVNN